jgi:sucrose phosphorylase
MWTTFWLDQIDLNYTSRVLLDIVDVLLFCGARRGFIRLDAIAYLWKEIGTPCIHLPQTHHVIQLLRAVLDQAAPQVLLITETNVPHQDNLSYFGDGRNEAQLVYNFALPPLTLHAFRTGDAALSRWAPAALPSNERRSSIFSRPDGIGESRAASAKRIAALVFRRKRMAGACRTKPIPTDRPAPTS